MSYETFRTSLVARLSDFLPPKMLNDTMIEIDILSQNYSFEKQCTDLTTASGMRDVIKAYIASLGVQNCSKSTLLGYKRELTHFFEAVSKSFVSVTANDIRCYLFGEGRNRNLQASSREHIRVIINGFFNWLVDNDHLTKNPARNVKPIKVPKKKLKPMQQIELEHVRNACHTPRELALVDFFYATGCRVSEVAAMTIDDINWVERSAIVRHGKGDKERITYFNAKAEVSLKKYLATKKGNDPHLFTKGRAPYDGLSRESLESEIRTICKRIPSLLSIKVTPHTFRRTMGTNAVAHGCPIEKVKELLGHESLDTTMQYVTIADNEVKAAHQKYLA